MESAESLSCLICIFTYLVNYGETLEYYIPEGQSKLTFVGNIAANSSIRDNISEAVFEKLEYRFLNVDSNKYLKHFSLDSKTSDLTINDPLDRETICAFSSVFSCQFEIEVAAQESIGAFFRKIPVTITVFDMNDHSPYFQMSPLFHDIFEDEVVGRSITLDTAIDRDSANYSVQSYELLTENVPFTTEFLKVDDGNKLFLVISGKLDRETTDAYSLSIVARDGGEPPRTGTLKINITVLDTNDNKPEFEKAVYNVTVKENLPVNSTILTVSTTDRDINENAEVMYYLDSQQPQDIKDSFLINDTNGEVKVATQLAYTPDNLRTVKIIAVDKGARPQTSSAVIEVRVEDSENNPPEMTIDLLSSTGYAHASEYANGFVVAYVFVKDSDQDRNGKVTCSIESGYFGLQPTELNEYKVIVINTLDRETVDEHEVALMCQDHGTPNLVTKKNFTVKILDENDNPPIFVESGYYAKIKENNVLNYTIKQVRATDRDIDENGRVSYYLNKEDQDDFYVHPKSGLILAKISFNRENTSRYEFPVFAADGGNPQLSTSVTITIDVEDVNDNPPVFPENPWKITTPESNLKDTHLGRIVANDSDEGGNGYISYTILNKPPGLPFEVLPDGTVKTTAVLDRETVPGYNFTVQAIDNGVDERLSSTVTVSVIVVDINDNYPIIKYPNDPEHIKYITYMMPEKTQIMKVDVSDADEGNNGELVYRITHRNDTNMFDLGRNGEIYVSRRMYESDIDYYVIGVEVSDSGEEPKSALTNITIVVLPRNETAMEVSHAGVTSQNIVIAVVVVLVTVVMAAVILIIIWIVKRIDRQKRKYVESMYTNQNGDNDSGFSSSGGRRTPDAVKLFDSQLLPSAPTLISSTNEKVEPKTKDVTFQEEVHVREKSVDSSDPPLENTVELHRLTSLRLHQALIQNQNKPWTSQTELNDVKDSKKQEDFHSDMSVDTLTYDSGIGGSVSDTGDLRLVQLQQMVRQSGRRGQPPHKNPHSPTKPPRIIARSRPEPSPDTPPERPPPLKSTLYKVAKSPRQNVSQISQPVSPPRFSTSSPTPFSTNECRYQSPISNNNNKQTLSSPPTISPRLSPSKNVVQDLLMYKKFQNGLKPTSRGHLTVDESVDTTHMDDDDSTTSGSYYIDNTMDEIRIPKVSDIYV